MTTSTPDPLYPVSAVPARDTLLDAISAGPLPAVCRAEGLSWPVMSALQSDRLRARGAIEVEVEQAGGRASRMPLDALLAEIESPSPRALYMRNQLLSELDPGLWELIPQRVRRLNWLLALPADLRPDWAWLMAGTAGTSTSMHVDTMASAAWNLLCSGRKKWTFHPPARSVGLGLLPAGLADEPGYPDAPSMALVQEPGDLVFTPSGWAHEVHNLTGTISVTANFINASNAPYALRYFGLVGDQATTDLLVAVTEAFAAQAGGLGGPAATIVQRSPAGRAT